MPDAVVRGLFAVTPDEPDDAKLLARCEAALSGGARVLQYRDKTSTATQRTARAIALAQACRTHGALFIVNDDAALAGEAGAHGVHLGRDDLALREARDRWPAMIIGVSCYADLDRAQSAVADGADYIAFGSMFASSTKPEAAHAPIDLIVQARRRFAATAARHMKRLAIVAIGGITRANCILLRDAGVDACAVITDLFGDTLTTPREVEARARQFQLLLEGTPT
jgi:thiamine-phosphate pyrophosphorylase